MRGIRMNKIIKIAPILLVFVLLVAINPASAYTTTHFHGLYDVTVHQGENLTLNLQVFYYGLTGEHCLRTDPNTVHLNIYNSNGVEVHPFEKIYCPNRKDHIVHIDTSILEPGTYNMYASFDGVEYFRQYIRCYYGATLTVLP